MFKKTKIALLVGSALASSSMLVNAAETTTEADATERMVVSGQRADYTVGTNNGSMRMEMTQLETPGQVAVIDSQMIDEQRAVRLSQVLENDASVNVEGNSRNRERFSLRGYQLGSASGFLRDGVQHWSHYTQPMELLDSVEILKGPSGLLYGTSAPGGLINMITKKPTADTQIELSQDIGSDNYTRTMFDISGSLNEAQTLRSRLVLSQENSESSRHYSDGSSPDSDRLVGGLYVEYDINDDVTIAVHHDRTDDDASVDSGAYVVDGEAVFGDDYIWDAQWSNIHNEVENTGFDIKAQLNDDWAVKTSFNYQDFKRHDLESSPDERNYDSATSSYTHGGMDRHDHWVFKTLSVDVTGEFETAGVGHQLLVGASWLGYSYDRVMYDITTGDTTVGEPNASPVIGDVKSISHSERDQYGVYIQDFVTINDQWQVLAGLRYDLKVTPEGNDDGSDEKLDAIVPKFGVIYKPADNGSIYATYSESFEPQSDVSDTDATNDGASLDPVTGVLLEVGTKWNLLNDQLFVSGALFEITEENSTVNVYESTDSEQYTVTQMGERVHRGAELAMQGNVTNELSMSASATYLDAEYTVADEYQGNRPADVPEYAATLWSRYQVTPETDVNLGAIYTGERYGDTANTFKKGGYTRFDFGIAHHLQYDKDLEMVFRLNVENIFDKEYYSGGGSTKDDYATNGAENVVVGEGRNFMATVQVRY